MKTKNTLLLFATIIYGLLYGLVADFFYTRLREIWYIPIVIAVYFCAFALGLFFVVYTFSRSKQKMFSSHLVRDICLTLIIILIASFFLEIIYEIGGETVYNEPTSYVFLIDDSGSMADNDPDVERIPAIHSVVNEKSADFEYAVYVFANDYKLVRSMTPKKDGMGNIELNSNGGTAIATAIRGVLRALKEGSLDGGEFPRILLLSDGQSSDTFLGTFSLRKELKELKNRGVSISTVGLGKSVDTSFMNSIARNTGGVYVHVENVDELAIAMKEAINTNAQRDLLGERPNVKADWLYAIMRLLFLFIIASLVLLAKCFGCGGSEFKWVLIWCTILNLIAAMIMEFGMGCFSVDGKTLRVCMCILIAVIVNSYIIYSTFSDSNSLRRKYPNTHNSDYNTDALRNRKQNDNSIDTLR